MTKNSKTAIQEIKKLMVQFGFISNEPALKSFKLQDNTIVETADLKAGQNITKISDEFERVALESGNYRLVENFEIEVKDGEIVSVKEIFLDAKLVDGTQIKVEGEELMEGAKVMVVTAEGEIPAPDGVHELEDGSKVETKDAVIVKIDAPMPVEAPEKEIEINLEEVVDDVTEDIGDPIEVEMMDMLKDFIKKMSEKMAAMEEKMNSVDAQFKAFKKEPAGRKIADGKTEFNKQESSDATENKIASIMRLRNK